MLSLELLLSIVNKNVYVVYVRQIAGLFYIAYVNYQFANRRQLTNLILCRFMPTSISSLHIYVKLLHKDFNIAVRQVCKKICLI